MGIKSGQCQFVHKAKSGYLCCVKRIGHGDTHINVDGQWDKEWLYWPAIAETRKRPKVIYFGKESNIDWAAP